MNYESYHLKAKEKILCAAGGILITLLISGLFYRSWYGLAGTPIAILLCGKQGKKHCIRRRKAELTRQFKDAMQSISTSLLAGYSMENAWREAEKELNKLYGEKAYMTLELQQMNAAIRMNQPIEVVLSEFAKRSGCEDIENFAEVFLFAKRSGGDFGQIIKSTVQQIRDKIEVEQEIATIIAGKKMEQKIMNVVPLFLLCYLNVTSKEFLEPLYGNLFGVLVMTGALVVYIMAVGLSEKIIDIKV